MSRVVPVSTIRPAYMTATRSHSLATMPRSCVTKMRARFVSRWISFRRRRYCAWMEIQRETNLALIFVTHDLGIVAKLCDRVAVMYAGRIVEMGRTREIFNQPRHPYTIGLLNCLPTLRRGHEPLVAIDGQPPDLAAV